MYSAVTAVKIYAFTNFHCYNILTLATSLYYGFSEPLPLNLGFLPFLKSWHSLIYFLLA